MKGIVFSIIISLTAGFVLHCSERLDSWLVQTEEIPTPTRSTIAYVYTIGNIHLRVTNPNYTKSYRLTALMATMPDWSPDKQWISYTNYNFQIWKMRYNGSDKQQLAPSELQCQGAKFSPDGRRLVFGVTRDSIAYDIFLMDSDGNHLETITSDTLISPQGEYSFVWPDWSPDGEKIIFQYYRVDTTFIRMHIGILELSTRNFTRIATIDSLQPFQPRWSPTKDEFLFTGIPPDQGGTDIYRADIDGKNIIRLTYDGHNWLTDWSSDGEWIIYVHNVDRTRTIWCMNRDGTENRQIIIAGEAMGSEPVW